MTTDRVSSVKHRSCLREEEHPPEAACDLGCAGGCWGAGETPAVWPCELCQAGCVPGRALAGCPRPSLGPRGRARLRGVSRRAAILRKRRRLAVLRATRSLIEKFAAWLWVSAAPRAPSVLTEPGPKLWCLGWGTASGVERDVMRGNRSLPGLTFGAPEKPPAAEARASSYDQLIRSHNPAMYLGMSSPRTGRETDLSGRGHTGIYHPAGRFHLSRGYRTATLWPCSTARFNTWRCPTRATCR